jgi:hypothetical protein
VDHHAVERAVDRDEGHRDRDVEQAELKAFEHGFLWHVIASVLREAIPSFEEIASVGERRLAVTANE